MLQRRVVFCVRLVFVWLVTVLSTPMFLSTVYQPRQPPAEAALYLTRSLHYSPAPLTTTRPTLSTAASPSCISNGFHLLRRADRGAGCTACYPQSLHQRGDSLQPERHSRILTRVRPADTTEGESQVERGACRDSMASAPGSSQSGVAHRLTRVICCTSASAQLFHRSGSWQSALTQSLTAQMAATPHSICALSQY